MVLLIVDTQEALVNDSLYQCRSFVENIRKLLDTARSLNMEVVYVIHDDGPGSSLTEGMPGFSIYRELSPTTNEKVFVKKVNSAFKDTGLADYLQAHGQRDVITVGLQTDKCLNATVICGFEHGFHMIVPAQANTTVDNAYMSAAQSWQYYNHFLWPDRYAQCCSVEEAIQIMKQSTTL